MHPLQDIAATEAEEYEDDNDNDLIQGCLPGRQSSATHDQTTSWHFVVSPLGTPQLTSNVATRVRG